MIPVDKANIVKLDINSNKLYLKQLRIIKNEKNTILLNAETLYRRVVIGKHPNLIQRCCNFKKLELG